MNDETEVLDSETEVEATGRKYTPLTAEQKQAATLRRDASLLRKYGQTAEADKLEAQADQIAPVRAHGNKRVDPLAVLTDAEQGKLVNHFQTTKKGFKVIAEHISAAKLAAIAGSIA